MEKGLNQLIEDIKQEQAAVRKLIEDAPRIIGVEAVNHAREQFDKQGFEGEKWHPRLPGTPRDSRPILVDTHTLKDSIRYKAEGRTITVGVDEGKVPYAEIQNEGGTINITPQMRKFFWAKYYETNLAFYKSLALAKGPFMIKARRFLAWTPQLKDHLDKEFIIRLNNIFKANKK